MSENVIVAIMAFLGTVLGSLFGILAANKLVNYRIEQLEKKVDKHNNVIERVFMLEKHVETHDAVVDEQIEVANHRIRDLEDFHK